MTWSTLNDPEEHCYFSKFVLHLRGDFSRQSLLLFLFAGRIHMETVVPNWAVPACCVLVLSGLEEYWIVEFGIILCVPWRNICALLIACLHLAEWAASFSGCRHPRFTLGIWYLEDPKQKSHTNTPKYFNLFSLLWGLGFANLGVLGIVVAKA